jgi:hypothetical protein
MEELTVTRLPTRLEDGDGQYESIHIVGEPGEIITVDVVTCGVVVGYCESKNFLSLFLFYELRFDVMFNVYVLLYYFLLCSSIQ